jgi:hypothetical protein
MQSSKPIKVIFIGKYFVAPNIQMECNSGNHHAALTGIVPYATYFVN